MSQSERIEPVLGIHLGNFAPDGSAGWAGLIERAQVADRCGIGKVIVSDHVAFGERLDEYGRPEVGGVRGGQQPTGPDGHWLEPLTLLTYLAATTQHVRLATHVLLAALRRPLVLAKTLATLDVLSGGRVDVGVGVGWQEEEYAAAGLAFADRGRLLDETIETCQLLWREQAATLVVDGNPVERIHQMPKPVQAGGVPIWISGTVNRRVVDRLARYGSGWIPWGDAAADLRTSLPVLRERVGAAGGDASRLRVVGNLATRTTSDGAADVEGSMAVVPQLVEAGVTDFVARIPTSGGAPLDETYSAWAEAFRNAATR